MKTNMTQFNAAFEAMPDKAENADLIAYLAAVAVSYFGIEDAPNFLLAAAAQVVKYAEMEQQDEECDCPKCTALRAAQPKH